MRVAILGATGGVGREVVAQALAVGGAVTALVREQPKPGEIDGRVAVVVGGLPAAPRISRADLADLCWQLLATISSSR